jgi:hypothetical protein
VDLDISDFRGAKAAMITFCVAKEQKHTSKLWNLVSLRRSGVRIRTVILYYLPPTALLVKGRCQGYCLYRLEYKGEKERLQTLCERKRILIEADRKKYEHRKCTTCDVALPSGSTVSKGRRYFCVSFFPSFGKERTFKLS